MPFKEIDVVNEIERKRATDPEFKKAWDEIHMEYKLIDDMIAIRKSKNITQKQLAEMTNNKPEVISKIECKKMMPTLKQFSHILYVLGYKLRVVNK